MQMWGPVQVGLTGERRARMVRCPTIVGRLLQHRSVSGSGTFGPTRSPVSGSGSRRIRMNDSDSVNACLKKASACRLLVLFKKRRKQIQEFCVEHCSPLGWALPNFNCGLGRLFCCGLGRPLQKIKKTKKKRGSCCGYHNRRRKLVPLH